MSTAEATLPPAQASFGRGGDGGSGDGSGKGEPPSDAEAVLELQIAWPQGQAPTAAAFASILLELHYLSALIGDAIDEPDYAVFVELIRHPNMALSLRGKKRILSLLSTFILGGAVGHILTLDLDLANKRDEAKARRDRDKITLLLNDDQKQDIEKEVKNIKRRYPHNAAKRIAARKKLYDAANRMDTTPPEAPVIEVKKLKDVE